MPVKYDNSSNGGGGGDDAFLAGFLGGVMESGENVWSNLQRKRKEDRDYQLQVDKFEEDKKYAKTAEERAVAQDEYNKWVREQAKAKTAADEARNKTIQGREDTEWGWNVQDRENLQEDRARVEDLQAKQDAAIEAGQEAESYGAGLPVQRPQLMQQYDEAFDIAADKTEGALDLAGSEAASGLAPTMGRALPGSVPFEIPALSWTKQTVIDGLKDRVARVYSNEAADRFSTVLAGVRQEAAIKVQNIAKQNPAAAANLAAAVETEFVKIQDEMEKRVAKKEVDGFDKQPWANTEFGQSILEQVANARATGQDPREIVKLVNTKRQERAAQLGNLQRINTVTSAIQRGVDFYNSQSQSSGAYAAERIAADNKSSRLQALLVDLQTANTDDLGRIVKEYKEITGSTGLPGFNDQMEFVKNMAGLSTKTQTPDPITPGSVTTTETPVFSPQEVRDAALGVQARNLGVPNPNPESGDAVYNTRPAQESLGIPAMPNESGALGRSVGALSLDDRRKWSESGRLITWDGKPALPRPDGKVYTAGYQVVRDQNLNNGRWTLIPTVWDGRPVDPKEATKRAIKHLKDNPEATFENPGLEGDKYNPKLALKDLLDRQQFEEQTERSRGEREMVEGRSRKVERSKGPMTWDNYPAYKNPDGSISTEVTITVTDPRLNNGRPTNIPTLWGGQPLPGSQAEVQESAIKKAVAYEKKNGKKWDDFNTIDEAVAYAESKSAAGGANAPSVPKSKPAQAAPQAQAKPQAQAAPQPPRTTGSARADLVEATLRNQPTDGRSVEGAGKYSFTAGVEGYLGSFGNQTGPIEAQIAALEKQLSATPKTDAEVEQQASYRRQLEKLKSALAQGTAYKTTDAGKNLFKSAQSAEAMINELVKVASASGGFYEKAIRELKGLPAQPSTPEEVAAWRKYLQANFGDDLGTPRAPGDVGLRARRIAAEADRAFGELYEGLNAGVGGS